MRYLLLLILVNLILPLDSFAKLPMKSRAVASLESKQLMEKIKKPEFVAEMMNTVKNRGSQINILRRHISSSDLRSLKQQGDLLKINMRDRMNIRLGASGSFSFSTDPSKSFKFSQDAKGVLFGSTLISVDRKQSLLTNYKSIRDLLRTQSRKTAGCALFSCAHAQISSDDSMAYNLTTLLYYMDVHTAGDGSIMWDYFLEDAEVQKALSVVTKAGKSIKSMRCDEIGMVIEYSDGTKSYLTQNGKNGADFEMSISETQTADGYEQRVEGTNSAVSGGGWFYYCGKLDGSQRDNTVSFLNMNLLAPSPVLETTIEQ